MKRSTESDLRLTWLLSATAVTVLRFLHPIAPSYDLGLQIQAAHHLLAGQGLSHYPHTLSNAPNAGMITLTHFPAGYSLVAAGLFFLGLAVGYVIKIIGTAGTLFGWWGWAKLAQPFFSDGLQRGVGWKGAAFLIALCTPLLFTPGWNGTDILLWATVPWVVTVLQQGSDERVPGSLRIDAVAGALCGLALLMRYASLFLALYAACVILWQSRLVVSIVARRWAAFALGFLPALAFQVYINYVLSNASPTPGWRGGSRLWDGMRLLYTASYPFAFWLPGAVQSRLFPEAGVGMWWQWAIALVGVLVLALCVVTFRTSTIPASRNPPIAAIGLFAILPVTLVIAATLGDWDYIADRRQYWPLVPLGVFVIYSMCGSLVVAQKGRVLRTVGVFYLTGYVVISLVYTMFLLLPGRIGTTQREKLLASPVHRWPSMAITDELLPARQFVMGLLKEQPGTVLLSSRVGLFHWDPAVDWARLFQVSCERLRTTYLEGPARIVIYTFDRGEPRELWYYGYKGSDASGRVLRASCFERLPDLHLLRRFPDEGVKILEAQISPDRRVSLKPEY